MSGKDDSKLPIRPPVGSPGPVAARPPRPPARTHPADDEEDVDDEATWAAQGSPYLYREPTSEVSFFDEDRESNTNIDWAGPGTDGGGSEETLNFDVRPSSQTGAEGAPVDRPTEPGFGDESLSALRHAMRSNPGSRPSSPGPLPIPAPRARTNPHVRPIPPMRRPGPRPTPRRLAPTVTPAPPQAPPPRPRRRTSFLAILGPVAVAAIAVLFVAMVALRFVTPSDDVDIEAPMLPVVGGPTPSTAPAPPFDVEAPGPFRPDLLEGRDADLEEMPIKAIEAHHEGRAKLAAAWSDKLVRADGKPSRFFQHGKLLADAGAVDAALYWLVRAEQEHGYPPSWLVNDRAFRRLWVDPRWDTFVRWVMLTKRHHADRGATPATIVLPASLEDAAKLDAARRDVRFRSSVLKGDGPSLPVVVWLDDAGGNGSGVLSWGQQLADEQGVLVVGLGGPERIGPAGSWWTSDPMRDREHVDNALAAIPGAVPDPDRTYLVGVGQGAQYAVELVLRDPTFAEAALALGPTDDWKGERDKAGEGTREREQSVVLAAGALDPATHTLLRLDRGRLMRAQVDVSMHIDEAPWPSRAPDDLSERVAAWVQRRLTGEAETDQGADGADNVAEVTPPAE